VSTFGRVKNKKSGRILKQNQTKDNYFFIDLFNGKRETRKSYKIHRLVAETFVPNCHQKDCVDHIDNNRENNKVNNLRWATRSENAMNQKVKLDSVKGIYYDNSSSTWVAQIGYKGRRIKLGSFDTENDAAQAYNMAAELLFKQFARLNKIDESKKARNQRYYQKIKQKLQDKHLV